MKKKTSAKKSPAKAAPTLTRASRVLGAKTFASMSAVEGLYLSPQSKKRLADLRAAPLTPAQRRAELVRAYKVKGPR